MHYIATGLSGVRSVSGRRALSLLLAASICSVALWGFASLLVHAGPSAPRWTAMLPLYVVAMCSLWIWCDLFEWDAPGRRS